MKKIISRTLIATTALLISTAALAQDSSIWAGPYVGATVNMTNFNEIWTSDENFQGAKSSPSTNSTDVSILIGYNTVKNNVVFGFEGDLGSAGGESSFTPGDTVSGSPQYMGHLRTRIGYAASDFLPYIGFGLTFADVTHKVTSGTNSMSESNIEFGLSTALGLEYAVSSELKVRAEYVMDRFVSTSVNSSSAYDSFNAKLIADTFKIGVAYSF